MEPIDLLSLPPGSEVRITDIHGHHTTLITTAQTGVENETSLSGVQIVTDEPDFGTSFGILPTGRTVDRYVKINEPYAVESFGSEECDMLVWSVSVAP